MQDLIYELRRKAIRRSSVAGCVQEEKVAACVIRDATEGGGDCDRPLGWAQTVTEGRVHSPPAGCFIWLVVLFQDPSFLACFYVELKVFQVVKIAAFVSFLECVHLCQVQLKEYPESQQSYHQLLRK